MEPISDGIAILNRDGCFDFVNQRAAEIFGRSTEELLGLSIWSVYPNTTESVFYRECDRALTERVPVHFQEFYVPLNLFLNVQAYPTASSLFVLLQTVPDRPQQQSQQTLQLTRTSALLAMQTKMRLQAETALKTTNAELAEILESITDGFCALDRQWRYRYINQRAELLLGHSHSKLLGKNIWKAHPQLVGSSFYHQCHEAVQTGTAIQLESFCAIESCWLLITVYPAPEGISIYFQDITDRKQIEAECNQLLKRERTARAQAEQAQQHCRFLSEASEVLASSLDYNTTLSSVARLAVPSIADCCLIHQLTEDKRLQQVVALHHSSQLQESTDEINRISCSLLESPDSIIAEVLRTRAPKLLTGTADEMAHLATADTRLLNLYGCLHPKSVMIIPLVARSQVLGTLLFATTTSERRYGELDLLLAIDLARRAAMAIDNAQLYQKAQEASQLKDEFLFTLSHELRTPLNAISGWAQMLQMRRLDEAKIGRAIETIAQKAKALVQIVYDLLDISRAVSGKLTLNSQSVELNAVIQAAIASLQLAADGKSIQLVINLEETAIVLGDRDRLQQVVWNLLSNAIKFTPPGGQVTLHLTLHRSEFPSAQLTIQDTGQGISPQFLPYVFDRFRQANGTLTRTHGGMGAGLAIVRHLVELHGGTVQASSPGEGQGATFTVQLPLRRDRHPADALSSSATQAIEP